jgi:ABC-type nickel/cobalt efflux system permease component RcnA
MLTSGFVVAGGGEGGQLRVGLWLVLDGGLRRLRRFGRKLAHAHQHCHANPIALADTNANAHANAVAHAHGDTHAGADGRMPQGRQVVGGGVERRR